MPFVHVRIEVFPTANFVSSYADRLIKSIANEREVKSIYLIKFLEA